MLTTGLTIFDHIVKHMLDDVFVHIDAQMNEYFLYLVGVYFPVFVRVDNGECVTQVGLVQ